MVVKKCVEYNLEYEGFRLNVDKSSVINIFGSLLQRHMQYEYCAQNQNNNIPKETWSNL